MIYQLKNFNGMETKTILNDTSIIKSIRPFGNIDDKRLTPYIYEAEKLATLSGNKLHGKKNHCNRFEKTYPDWRFEVLTKEHFPACLALLDQWEAAKDNV